MVIRKKTWIDHLQNVAVMNYGIFDAQTNLSFIVLILDTNFSRRIVYYSISNPD